MTQLGCSKQEHESLKHLQYVGEPKPGEFHEYPLINKHLHMMNARLRRLAEIISRYYEDPGVVDFKL